MIADRPALRRPVLVLVLAGATGSAYVLGQGLDLAQSGEELDGWRRQAASGR